MSTAPGKRGPAKRKRNHDNDPMCEESDEESDEETWFGVIPKLPKFTEGVQDGLVTEELKKNQRRNPSQRSRSQRSRSPHGCSHSKMYCPNGYRRFEDDGENKCPDCGQIMEADHASCHDSCDKHSCIIYQKYYAVTSESESESSSEEEE